uniref:Uncharacterized protein n=1 Tax=Knipowitschia caucasica TaxID=637954 RepID=A0AAV2KSM9_KNICA
MSFGLKNTAQSFQRLMGSAHVDISRPFELSQAPRRGSSPALCSSQHWDSLCLDSVIVTGASGRAGCTHHSTPLNSCHLYS